MKNQRINYLSLANVISAFAVVMMHANNAFWKFKPERFWLTANIIESVMFFAVPIFFMISGATLIDYRERYSTKEYFKKRIDKAVIPYLVWSVIFIIWRGVHDGAVNIPSSLEDIKELVMSVLNFTASNVYWFFGPLFGIYLCIPLFSSVQKELRLQVFRYLMIMTFFLNILLPFLNNQFQVGYENKVTIDVVGGYLFYVLAGYVLNKETIEKKWRLVSYILGLVGLAIHMIGTYVLSMEAGQIITTYKGYTNVPCVLYSLAVFIFIKEIGQKIKNQKIWDFINWAGKYTFAIYLMHWFVLRAILDIIPIGEYSILYRLGAPIPACAICIFITWLLRKIPGVKKIVP